MQVNIGFSMLVIAFTVCVYGMGAAIYGGFRRAEDWLRSARLSAVVTFPLITIAVIVLEVLILTGRYDVAYVYEVANKTMPAYLKVTAIWGGQDGSLLFWCWLVSLFLFIYFLRHRQVENRTPWMVSIPLATLAFFLAVVVFTSNPFRLMFVNMNGEQILSVFQPSRTLALVPVDGIGLNPLLRHPGMVFHPPLLYLGYIGFLIPFSSAVADLINGSDMKAWVEDSRPWIIVAWLCLFAGLLLGSRWAYDVLGWGGYWGWDPVEVAALMPWLSATTLLHTMLLSGHGSRGRRWNVILIMLTFWLVIFGTFVTRSGLISSVHAFAQSSLSYLLLGFIAVLVAGCAILLAARWKSLAPGEQDDGILSRQTLFQVVNLIFLGVLAVCFWGVVYPSLAQVFSGRTVNVGPAYYKTASGPLFAAILLLMGVCPLLAWARSSWKNLGKQIILPLGAAVTLVITLLAVGIHSWLAIMAFAFIAFSLTATVYDYLRAAWIRRKTTKEHIFKAFWNLAAINRKRYGGYIIHIGVALLAIGIIGIEFFQTQTELNIKKGASAVFAGYTIQNNGITTKDEQQDHNVTTADFSITKNDRPAGTISPHIDNYSTLGQTVSIPAVRSTLADDLYIVLAGADSQASSATIKVFHNPLVNWLWIGGVVLMAGAVVALLPPKKLVKRVG